jgi:hypothetical protein
MKLVASMIVRDELHRYLVPCIDHLQEFCDEIVVLVDGSEDDYDALSEWQLVKPRMNNGPSFFEHEGRARQKLLDFTMEQHPTHILAIDADEFIGDGQHLRQTLETEWARHRPNRQPKAWRLQMQEVWKVNQLRLFIRRDGGWRPHNPPLVYHPPSKLSGPWRIRDRALASGREPQVVGQFCERGAKPITGIYHFGWTNESERAARYQRYIEHDNGDFHQQKHIHSIMWPDQKVFLTQTDWPPGLSAIQSILLDRATRESHVHADRP